jgi:tetratricopeptide (TPR) repeat protein
MAFDMATTPGLVTVIVRSMDRVHLRDALASLAAQDYPALEVLVVDATGGRHRQLPALDWGYGHAIRLVASAEPLQRPQAAQLGLTSASGEWFTILDDDDTCAPTHISELVAAARARPQALVVYGSGRLLGADGRIGKIYGRPFNRALMHFAPLLSWQASLIRTAVRDLGCCFDPEFPVCEDRDFLAQVAMHGDFAFVPGLATFNYRPNLGTSGTGEGVNRDFARVALAETRLRAKWAGPGTWHNERVTARCRRAARAFRAGDIDLAARILDSVLLQYPGDPNASHGLARIALARGDRTEAERLVRAAIDINPRAESYRATLAAITGQVEWAAGAAATSGSRLAACPCGSGRKFKACCGRPGAAPSVDIERFELICKEAEAALAAGDAAAAFEMLERASGIRHDAGVTRLLEVCCTKLTEHLAMPSLWSTVRAVCAESAGTSLGPARSVLVIGKEESAADAIPALQRANVAEVGATLRVVESLESAAGAVDGADCVAICSPDDVPAYGVSGVGPGRVLLMAGEDGAFAVVRALARLADGWPRARLCYLGTGA